MGNAYLFLGNYTQAITGAQGTKAAIVQNLQNNPDKAQALRQAMLTTMKTHPQPRNWAAFTLIGEAE